MKIKHITLFTAFALAAFAFTPSARAVGDIGDIRGIHAVSPDVLFPNEGEKMGHDSPLSIGQKVYILVRMLNEDWEETYGGSTPHPWYFKPTGFGSTNMTAVALGISVGGRPDVATYSDFGPDFRRSGVNPDVPYYTDFYFVYTVKANDLGLPIELVDKTGAKVQDNNGFYLLNVRTDGNGETFAPFMLVNDSTPEQHLANFIYGPLDIRTDESPRPSYPAYPGKQNYDPPLDEPGPHRSYTLAQEEVYVQTIDFDHVNAAGEPWSKGEVWRVVQQGSAEKRGGDLWPTISSKGGATVYVWSEDNAKAYVVPYGEGQEYVDETRKVLKISLDAGSSSFKIYGAGEVGDTVDILLSSQPFEQVTKLGDVLDYNVCRRTVQVTEPPKPSIEITTRNAQGIDVSMIKELEALANPEENVIELKVSITKPYSETESLEIDLAAVFTNGTGAAVADSPTNGYIRILSEPDDPREAPNALPRVTIGPNETSATVYLYALGSCSLPAERKSDPNAKRVVINPVLVDPSAAEVFTGGLSGFEIKKLSDQAPEILGPVEGETFTVREGSQMDVPVLLSDNWRDLQEAYNTNGYKVAWTFTSGGVSGETNRVAFAEDTSVSVYPTAPNRDSDMIVMVTDPAGNSTRRTVHVNVTPKPKAEVRFYTDATRQTRYLGDFLEHAQDTPYYLDVAFVDGSEAPADMWAFLEPLDANATNLVVCSAVSNGIEIVQGRTNSQYAVAIGVLDGFSPMNPMTARFNVLFRSAPEIGDATATDYTDDCGRPSVTVRAVNVAPEVPYVKVDTDKILDGETLAQTIPSGLAVQFKAKLSDLSEKDLAVDDGAKAIWTLWEYTDNFDGYEAGGGRTVMVTNGLQSFATCPITFHYEDTVQRIRVYALDKDERNGETDPDNLDALWGDPKLTLYVKVAATPTVQIVQKVNGQMVVLTAEDEMLFMEDKMKSTAGDFYVQLSDKPGDSAAGEIGITKDNPIAVQIVLEKYGDGNVDVDTNYVYFTSSADVSAKPVKLNVETLNGGRETLYAVSATVVRNEDMHDQYGSTWDEHFFPATTSLRVLNVPPVINTVKRTNGTWSETGTNTCSAGEAIHLSWKVTDITNDFTRTSDHEFTLTWSIDPPSGYVNPQIITNGWKITSSGGTKGYVTGEYEFIIPAVSGYSKVELHVNDGDSENDVIKEWWYYVAPTKPLEINVFGPSATGKSKYKGAKGRGMGLVGVKGTTIAPLVEQFVQTWTFAESAADASVYAWGYPATNTWHEFWNYDTTKPHYATLDMGNVPGDLGHSATGVALNKYGSKYGTGDEYFDWSTRGGRDEDAGRYDSFFYRWVITKAAGGDASAETLLPAPTTWPLDPSGETIPLDDGGDKGVYGKVVLEAVFSRELREKDNLGDINIDGIPDKIVETFGLGAGSIGTFPEDDLADLRDLNDDEDILPAMDTSAYGTFIPGLKESWATWGTPFTARREIRGEHEGLNDAPKQPVIGLSDYRLESGYYDDDLEKRIAARDYSEVEMMAWADHGYAKDWTPECPSDPTKEDTDDDGMPDGYEYYFWYKAHVGYIDADGAHKYLVGRRYEPTHPAEPTEILPGEIERIMNPQVPYADGDSVKSRDIDNDGLPDLIEFEIGTNPFDYDTDGDGLPDGYEVIVSCTDPLLAATDMRINDGSKNPDGDTMAVYEDTMQVVGVWNAKKSAVEYYCCAPNDDTNRVFQIADVTNTYTRITCLSASALKAIGGVTNIYVTTAPVQAYTNAEGVVSLVGGLSSENTWIVAGDGFRGRPADVLAGTVITKDPEIEVEVGEKTLVASTNVPPVYYKAWVRDISTDKDGKLRKTFVRGREYSAAKGPFAKEGAPVVDFWKEAKVLVQHFYVYQEHGFDPRTAWKRPPAPPECIETVNFTTLDELYLQTFFYHADLLTDADLTPTLRVGWADLWPRFCTSPVHCDTDEDGIPDGWELYVLAGPKAYDEGGNPAIGYNYDDDFSPLTPTVDPQPTADGDTLSAQQEFSGVHSVAEYDDESYYKTASYAGDGAIATLVQAAVTVKLDNELWTNKLWPTDPWNADTDNDGIPDNVEGGAFLHNGGLNPLSWDTDKDGLPDPWELEFAGTVTIGGAGTNAVAAAGGSTNATASATNATAWVWNEDGMDGTVDDAMKDYDYDGLRNWQEYMVGAMRCWRYDDITSPWTVNVGDIPSDGEGWYNVLLNPESPKFNPGLADFILDPGLYFSCATNAYEQVGVFGKFYMLKDGYYHDLKIDAQTREDKMNRWVRNLADPALQTLMAEAYPTKYICCDPRLYDTDEDGMDDFYELFHGLDPLLGPEIDIVAQSWGYPKFPLCAVYNNWYEGMAAVRTRTDKPLLYKGLNDRDFFQFPWLAGLPDADPDGDNIRNQQEALFSNVQAASTYLHVDPTPLWMTDGQYEDSLTYRYYHISTPIWGILPKIWMPGKPYFEYNGTRYYWNDFPWIHYDEKTGICSMDYSINNWQVMDYMFSFEENEGYDSDHDYLGDFEEGQGKTKSASDPQVSDSPLRRQAMWFGGEADKGFLETTLEVDELPPEDAGAEEGQRFLYYTVECWAKPDESTFAKAGLQTLVERAIVSGPGNAGDETWLRKNFVLGLRNGRWYTRFDSTGTDANQPVEIAGGPEVTTNWTHVAATYDGTALRLYVNGVCTPATTEYTSIQPEHGVNAIIVNDLSEYAGKVTVEFAGDRGLGVPQIAMLVGASALDSLAVTFDYQWQTRSVALFGYPRGINTMAQTTMGDYGNFFRGYIDEVRVWDGARRGADILADYEQRVRYDSALALENREKVFKSWAKGGSRLDRAVEQLPPQLMHHWSFDHVAGAVDRADVMRVPAGFDTSWNVVDSMAIWVRPVGWTSFWLDEGVNGSLWNGQVFSDHAWQPWVTDTISHLPRFDGTVLDSVYWSEDFTGARPVGGLGYTKLLFPRNAEVPSRWTQMLYADEGEAWAEDTRWEIIQATGDEELMQKYMFARRYLPTVGGDLMIFGSAYAKRISAAEGGMWDDQGPADAWAQTGSDADHNGLADWWEEYARENYGVDPFTPIDWTTTVNYEGRSMPAWEAYLRDLSRGLTVVNGAAKVRGEYADSRDVDMDGIPDWWEDLYHVDTQSTADTLADPDGDGLGNYVEYLISEKFGFARLNPRDPKTDGVCVDYFRRKGDLYLGEIFTDHDQVNDVWEDKYAGFADFYAYDPSRDDDGDGWSNWAEQKAGTDPRLVKETGIDDYTLAGYPVPCIRARIVNNGLTVETAPVVIKAWSERRDPGMTGDPDATWTVAGSAKDGQQQASGTNDDGKKAAAEMGESSKYLGIKPEGARTLTLGPGAIERNSVKIFYKDLSFCKAQIVGGQIVPTEIGSELEAEWYYLVHDREGKLYTTGGIFADEQEVGTVDYDTGAVTIDFGNDALCGILLGDPGTTAADGETPTYDLLNLDQSYVLVTWNSSARSGSLNRTLYLADADDPGDISGRFDHVREGLNTFIAFVDRNGDGAYTAGEPYGFVRGVDVGWSGAEFEIELTETSPVFARVNVFDGASDRLALWGTSCGDTAGASKPTASNDTWGASANAYEHVRIVPYMVAGVYTDGEGSNSFVHAVDYVENRVVAEFDVRKDTKPYITEADFIRDGAFDIDWDGFSTSAFANNSRLTSAIGEVTAVKYRIIFGNEGPIGDDSNLDPETPGISSFQTLIERRFERTAARTKPTNLSVDGVVCDAQPLFGWRLDEPTGVQVYVDPNTGIASYVEPAARYGCGYTAFEIQVADRDGNVVYDSGVVRAPVRDADGFFRWTPTDLYAGDQTALGEIFSAAGNWQWRVAMYNSKFKPNVRETMNGWSAWQEFSTSVGTGNALGDLAHETIDVSVKYTGPVKVLDGCEDLSTPKGTVRVQAFVSPDFSGEPVAQGFIADKAALTDVADAAANGRLIGLMPGDYYLRAYVDTNGNLRKDDWESWGAAAGPVKVGPGIKVPVISFFIEDADTDQDWIPDAWEMQVNKSLDVDNVTVLPDGQIKFKLIYPETKKTALKSAAAPVTFFQNLNATRMLLTSEADGGGDALAEILAATQSKAVPGTVAITSLALDANKGEAVLTVTGETAKSAAAELLDAIYVFPDQPLTLGVYRKNSLLEKDWTWVKDVPVTLGTGAEAKVTVQLGDDLDMTQGFYMVEIKQ